MEDALTDDFQGIYEWSQNKGDLFADARRKVINYDFFRRYFDQVNLPMDLARACLDDLFDWTDRQDEAGGEPTVKFLPLSTLKKYRRLPEYHDVQHELVDHSVIENFQLQGRLDWWGGKDIFSVSPCVFVSHRWQSVEHPDPDGTQLEAIATRLEKPMNGQRGTRRTTSPSPARPEEIYLWIDFCCMANRRGPTLSESEARQLGAGLGRLPGIVKSCDLMILHSPDYLSRAWCFSELFVWLCKLAEIGFARNDGRSKLFESVQTRHLVRKTGLTDGHHFDDSVVANLAFRGYEGPPEELLRIYGPIREYCSDMENAAQYNIAGGSGNFDAEYLPIMANFLCRSWLALQKMECTLSGDREVCLRVIMDGLKYRYLGTGS